MGTTALAAYHARKRAPRPPRRTEIHYADIYARHRTRLRALKSGAEGRDRTRIIAALLAGVPIKTISRDQYVPQKIIQSVAIQEGIMLGRKAS